MRLDQANAPVLDDDQMQRFEFSDIGFHIALLRMAGNRRSLKVVNQARQLIRIFAERRGGHDRVSLERIYRQHYDIVRAIALRKPDEPVRWYRNTSKEAAANAWNNTNSGSAMRLWIAVM